MSFAPEVFELTERAEPAGAGRRVRVTPRQVAGWLGRLEGRRVAVIGDAILDEFLWGDSTRISPEAPVPVVLLEKQHWRLGGAANVAANIAGLGGHPTLFAAAGEDSAGDRLEQLLRENGIEIGALPRLAGRPTTVKSRVLAQNKHLLRFDREETTAYEPAVVAGLIRALAEREFDAVAISDYAKGCVSAALVAGVAKYCGRRRAPWCADPKSTKLRYGRATVLKPNLVELEALSGQRIGDEASLRAAAARTLRRQGSECLLVTRGRDGMALFERDGGETFIRGGGRQVADVTGAGDTVTAAVGLGLAAGLGAREAAILANLAGAMVVAIPGTAVARREDMAAELDGATPARGSPR